MRAVSTRFVSLEKILNMSENLETIKFWPTVSGQTEAMVCQRSLDEEGLDRARMCP